MILDRVRGNAFKCVEGFAVALAKAAADPSVTTPLKNADTISKVMLAAAYMQAKAEEGRASLSEKAN